VWARVWGRGCAERTGRRPPAAPQTRRAPLQRRSTARARARSPRCTPASRQPPAAARSAGAYDRAGGGREQAPTRRGAAPPRPGLSHLRCMSSNAADLRGPPAPPGAVRSGRASGPGGVGARPASHGARAADRLGRVWEGFVGWGVALGGVKGVQKHGNQRAGAGKTAARRAARRCDAPPPAGARPAARARTTAPAAGRPPRAGRAPPAPRARRHGDRAACVSHTAAWSARAHLGRRRHCPGLPRAGRRAARRPRGGGGPGQGQGRAGGPPCRDGCRCRGGRERPWACAAGGQNARRGGRGRSLKRPAGREQQGRRRAVRGGGLALLDGARARGQQGLPASGRSRHAGGPRPPAPPREAPACCRTYLLWGSQREGRRPPCGHTKGSAAVRRGQDGGRGASVLAPSRRAAWKLPSAAAGPAAAAAFTGARAGLAARGRLGQACCDPQAEPTWR
jgi:hypothetical protein